MLDEFLQSHTLKNTCKERQTARDRDRQRKKRGGDRKKGGTAILPARIYITHPSLRLMNPGCMLPR